MSARFGAVLVGLAVLFLLPSHALASSIAFIKGDDVWLISPDGSRQKQVTTDGTASKGYAFPSQADDGTILAKFGDLFVRLRPDGTKIGDPFPAVGSDVRHSGNLFVMAGPAGPRISPDGTRFAYWISARSIVTCPIWDPFCTYQDTDYTIVSRVDRFTAPEEFKAVRSYRDPSWVGNDRLLVFNHGLLVKQAALSTVGAGEPGLQQWFDPPSGLPQISQGEMTRQGHKIAALAGYSTMGLSQEYVFLYGVNADYPTEPEAKCYLYDAAPPSGRFMQPSWSPDGTAFALTESDGIHVFSNIPDLGADEPDCSQITEHRLVYGSEPGWGPADVPADGAPTSPAGGNDGAARPSAGRGTGTAPTPPGGQGTAGQAPPTDLAFTARQQGRAIRVSLRVRVTGSTVRVRLRSTGKRSRTVGAATKRNAPAGPLTLHIPLNRRGRAALQHNRRLTITAEVSLTPADGTPTSSERRLTLKR